MRFSLLLAAAVFALPLGAQLPVDTYVGQPTFSEGTSMGYYVWKDGDKWKLRWTTRGAMRIFAGSVTADGGKLSSLKKIDVESERKVLYPGHAPHTWIGRKGRIVTGPGAAPVYTSKDQDHFEMDGKNRITFDAHTNDDIDGFDFKVSDDVKKLTMILMIAGLPRPLLVEVGANNTKPGVSPLVINLQ